MRPPRIAERVLSLLPRDRDSDVIRGDLLEEYRRRAIESGSRRADAWYWREALSLIARSHGHKKMLTLDHLRQDVRFAFRSCRKSPVFTLVVVITLALGIGASTAIFSAVNTILLRPLPFPEPDRVLWINEIIHSLDRDMPVFNVRPMTAVMDLDIAQQRMAELVLGLFAVVALALAAIGLYGLVAHSVTERTHEIGVRMALGATRGSVLRMIVRDGLSMTVVGAIAGLAGAAALGGTLRGLLFGVKPIDPATLASVVALLSVTSVAACLVPAWRAVRIPPTTALRAE